MKRKDIRDLLPEGYGLRQVACGHLRVTHVATGEPLRSETGLPITVALTPSDWRSAKNEAARIRRALAADGGDRTATASP